MAGNPDIEEGAHHCPTCNKRTEWKGTKVQRCYGCSRRFPCGRPVCRHQDCEAHRAIWGVSVIETLETAEAQGTDSIFEYLAS